MTDTRIFIRHMGPPHILYAGEIIKHDYVRGGILTCELAVLDDISRAPGEALNVLLRVLNERKFGSMTSGKIPLMSAIATGNPVNTPEYYGDPLDPATLDRFTLQLRASGLVQQGNWSDAGKVIDLYAGPRAIDDDRPIAQVPRSLLHDASGLVPQVRFGPESKRVLLRLLQVECCGGDSLCAGGSGRPLFGGACATPTPTPRTAAPHTSASGIAAHARSAGRCADGTIDVVTGGAAPIFRRPGAEGVSTPPHPSPPHRNSGED